MDGDVQDGLDASPPFRTESVVVELVSLTWHCVVLLASRAQHPFSQGVRVVEFSCQTGTGGSL